MTIKEMIQHTGLNTSAFGREYNIPLRTLQHWEAGTRKPPEYVLNLLERLVLIDYPTRA